MCGIAGVISTERGYAGGAATHRMLHAQRHRGPDGEGSWSGSVGNFEVALGHLRMAIIELTEAARQPMFPPDGSQRAHFLKRKPLARGQRPPIDHLTKVLTPVECESSSQ